MCEVYHILLYRHIYENTLLFLLWGLNKRKHVVNENQWSCSFMFYWTYIQPSVLLTVTKQNKTKDLWTHSIKRYTASQINRLPQSMSDILQVPQVLSFIQHWQRKYSNTDSTDSVWVHRWKKVHSSVFTSVNFHLCLMYRHESNGLFLIVLFIHLYIFPSLCLKGTSLVSSHSAIPFTILIVKLQEDFFLFCFVFFYKRESHSGHDMKMHNPFKGLSSSPASNKNRKENTTRI